MTTFNFIFLTQAIVFGIIARKFLLKTWSNWAKEAFYTEEYKAKAAPRVLELAALTTGLISIVSTCLTFDKKY